MTTTSMNAAPKQVAALDALPDRPVTSLDLSIFDAAFTLVSYPEDGDAQGMADQIAALAAGGYDVRVVNYACNLAMRSVERRGWLDDPVAFFAEVSAACSARAAS